MTHATISTSDRTWDNKIENALVFGQIISWREVSEFCKDLSCLLENLVSFGKNHPSAALPIFEIFFAGCLEKCDEIDGSGNDLGIFLDELACAWI